MRHVALLFVLCGLLVHGAQAQNSAGTGSITGVVRAEGGEPIPGATIRIEGGTLGAVSKRDGTFTIQDVPAGAQRLTVRSLGYTDWAGPVTVRAREVAAVRIILLASVLPQSEVVVRADGKRRPASDTRTSVTRIDPREVKYLPGAAEDVMRSLRSLPGILAPNDFSSQLVVRGSGPDQNLIVIDDIEVFNPYRLYGFVSMFNPETVSEISLISGGFPARYGDRLSAVLDVQNREGGSTGGPVAGKVNASATNANVVLEGELPGGMRGGWLLSGRRTYYDLILGPIARSAKLVDGDVAFPNFRDVQFKAVLRPWADHSFVVNAITSRDATELVSGADRAQIDSFSINDNSTNSLVGVAWRFAPSARVLSKTLVNWYQNEGETQFGGEGGSRLLYGDLPRDSVAALIRGLPQPIQDSLRVRGITAENPPALGISDGNAGFNFRKYTVRNETSLELGGHVVEFGAGTDFIRTAVLFSAKPDTVLQALRQAQGRNAFPDSLESSIDYYRAHAFLQDRIGIGERLYLQGGVRFDYYKLIDRAYVVPRLSASYVIDDRTTLRAAFGIYYQSPGYEKLLDRQTYFDLTSPEVANLRAERATHYVLGLDRMLDDEWQIRAETYYKRFSDLIVQQKLTGTRYVSSPVPGGDTRLATGWGTPVATVGDSLTSTPVNDATGEAYGVEILLQKIGSRGNSPLSGWIGYSLAWANRYRDGITFPFNFDQRHTLNLVLNYRANSWLELGSSFQFGSGFPYTPAIGYYPVVVMNTDTSGVKQPAVASNVFGEALFSIDRGGVANINSARLPAYHRLDIRATVYTKWWNLDWALYLDVINVYNHSNILSRSFSVDKQNGTLKQRDVGMLPILPTLGLSVTF